ncbi:Cytochrome P450 71A22 [Hirschfeldia incana]|nr:Cytochrome P450 71A22 [Hirschfeldia incana]
MIMVFLLCLILFITILFFKKGNTIPSPLRLPLIGNLHQLGHHPHRSLCSLSHRYGPIMLVHFGCVPVLIISSAEAAQEVFKTHDRVFASRPRSKVYEKVLYGDLHIGSAPYGEYWRKTRSVFVTRLLSNKLVQSFRGVRREEVSLLMEKIRKSNSLPVNLSELFSRLTNDVVSRVTLGRKYSGAGTDFKELTERLLRLAGAFTVGTFVPWLAWVDWLRGLDGQREKTKNEFDEIFEKVIQDHEDGDGHGTDFVDVLLAIQRDKSLGVEIERINIKAIILDAFVGGTDSSATLLEWEMTELLRHPSCLKRLQEEVRTVCKDRSSVSEDNIKDMKYLNAVLKETLRLHPSIPLMIPHETIQDVNLSGHHIPAGTMVMINAWTIGREAATWGPDAESFRPERHLNTSVDFRGQDFQLIPFGAGRRICPGMSFAVALNELTLANLMLRFDWKSTGDQTETVVAESISAVVRRMFPLYAIASPTT